MSQVLEEERQRVREILAKLVMTLERFKPGVVDEAAVMASVKHWEQKTFDKSDRDRVKYMAKSKEKRDLLIKEISKLMPLKVDKVNDAVQPVSVPEAVATEDRPLPKSLLQLYELLESTRLKLRAFIAFESGHGGQVLKRLYTETQTGIVQLIHHAYHSKLSRDELIARAEKLGKDLNKVNELLEPRFKSMMEHLGFATVEEVLKVDEFPLGMFLRVMENGGNKKIRERCKRASFLLGGPEALKRVKQ
jgi:hypothetical protein